MLDFDERSGLVCGYKVDAGGQMAEVVWSGMDEAVASEDALVWLHFNQADVRSRDWISRCERIPAAAKAILLGNDARMRIEPSGNGLAGVVGDLHREFDATTDRLDVLRLFLDSHCLISARRQPLEAIDKLRRSMGEGLRVQRPIGLMIQFLHNVTDTLGELILELSTEADRVEDGVLSDDYDDTGPDLARIRRVTAGLRRHMVPQQHALIGLLARLPRWVEEEEATRLRSAIERLGALGHDLDHIQERARLLQDQLSSRLMEATNRNLYTLSIVTTIFLPMTLVTGVFGMNLGGLPGQQDGSGFWWGILVMVLTGALTLFLLRRQRML